VLPAVPVAANTLHVTNCTDSGVTGDGSLRGEIAAAGVGDTIVFDQDCTGATAIMLVFYSGTLTLTRSVTIDGTGHTITVDGGCVFIGGACTSGGVTVFTVNSGVTASLSNLSLQEGRGLTTDGGAIANSGILSVTNSTISNSEGHGAGGGGILNSGTLTVTNSTITGNLGDAGGGIANGGTATVTNSTITLNVSGAGGGILNSGTLTLTNSTLAGNSVGISGSGSGGGIANNGGTLTVMNSLIDGNGAPDGGGIANLGGTLTLTNSTISRNLAVNLVGGIRNSGTATVTNSTISGNSNEGPFGIGGIYNASLDPLTLTLTNTIVAGNTDDFHHPPDLGGIITSGGHNLFGTTSGATITLGTGDIVNPTPLLGPIGNNGGPTQTIALLAGSPAIDAGNDAVCAQTGTGKVNGVDQRGITRPQGGHCDIGAFEYQVVNPLPPPKPPGPAGGPPSPLPAVRPPGSPAGVAPNPLPVPRP
jgi:hypothetical protein